MYTVKFDNQLMHVSLSVCLVLELTVAVIQKPTRCTDLSFQL